MIVIQSGPFFSFSLSLSVLLFVRNRRWRMTKLFFASKMQIHCSICLVCCWIFFCCCWFLLLSWWRTVAVVCFAEFGNWTAFKLEWASWNVSNICQKCNLQFDPMYNVHYQKNECRFDFSVQFLPFFFLSFSKTFKIQESKELKSFVCTLFAPKIRFVSKSIHQKNREHT